MSWSCESTNVRASVLGCGPFLSMGVYEASVASAHRSVLSPLKLCTAHMMSKHCGDIPDLLPLYCSPLLSCAGGAHTTYGTVQTPLDVTLYPTSVDHAPLLIQSLGQIKCVLPSF